MNAVMENILKRRSSRSFTDKAPSKADLETILKAATYAPSGMNTQGWQFTVIQKKETLEKLNIAIREALGRPADYVCYYGAPVLILASHDKESSLANPDCACALQNMFLAATSLGIDSCWINQLCYPESRKDAKVLSILTELGVPQSHYVYGCAALGYATSPAVEKPRREGTIVWAD